MNKLSAENYLLPLFQAGCSEEVIKHCVAVEEKALELAGKIRIVFDKELIREGALYHDIGRARTHSISHALAGAEIAREMGMDERVVSIIEKHIGSGIPEPEAVELGLPARDYLPSTPEEIIVAYADNLAIGEKVVSFEEAFRAMQQRLGKGHPALVRFTQMHLLVQSWIRQ